MSPEQLYASVGGTAARVGPQDFAFLAEHLRKPVVLGELLLEVMARTRRFATLGEHLESLARELPGGPAALRAILDRLVGLGLLRHLGQWLADAVAEPEPPPRPPAAILLLADGRGGERAWIGSLEEAALGLPVVVLGDDAVATLPERIGGAPLWRVREGELLARLPEAEEALADAGDAGARRLGAALLLAAGERVLCLDARLAPPLRRCPEIIAGVGLDPEEERLWWPPPEGSGELQPEPPPTLGELLGVLGRRLGAILAETDAGALAEGLRGFEAASLGASHLRRRVAMARLGERGAFEPGPWQFVPEPPPAVREDFQAYADWLQHPRAITGRPRPSASLPWAHGAVAFDLALLMPPPVFGRGRAAGRLFGLAAAALNPELCAFEFPWTLARPERTPSNWLVTEPLGREEELLAAWVRRAGEALHPERPADRAALLGELLEGSAAMAEARLRRELEEFRLQRLTRPLPAITARLLATPKGGPWREGLEAVLRRVSQALLESDRCLLPAAWIEPEAARALLRRYARALAAQRRAHERALERRPLARLLAGA